MPTIRFNDLFPEGNDGTRKPLPKQLELFNKALDPAGPKFIAYVSGIGGGKTLSGCITMIAQGVMNGGDYLIGRQFSPELKATTYKQFMEILPPELLVEHRVADMQVTIKAVKGTATFFFRPLEEWDKFRSMNLSGFMIDEANQVSEEAFMLLQGRLRGKGLRKGIVVSNPAGHDWLYRWFFKKDHINAQEVKDRFYLIRGSSLENPHLPSDYISGLLSTWSDDRIQREIMGSFDAFEGAVYTEFRRDVHVIKPFRIPDEWPRHIRMDHGYRNPAAAGFYAVGTDGEVYKYREFYESEWLISEILLGKVVEGVKKPGVIALGANEKFVTAKIDPSTRARRGSTGESDFDEYARYWPKNWPVLNVAKNDVQLGIDRVKSYLKVNPATNKPLLYIFDTCVNTIEEMTQYRYPELRSTQAGKRAEHEKPVKVNDHAMDETRYMIIDLPDPAEFKKEDAINKLKFGTIERKLAEELQIFKKPPQKDPFEGGF